MEHKFKVGDRVRIRQWNDMEREFGLRQFGDIACRYGFTKPMIPLCGRAATITDIDGDKVKLKFDNPLLNTAFWNYSTGMIEHLISEEITIKRYGNKVVAKWGKRVGVAKCNPEDKFDFATGALLAFDRLFKSENVTRKIIDDALDRVHNELYEINGIKKIE